jgi:hypothetical protein
MRLHDVRAGRSLLASSPRHMQGVLENYKFNIKIQKAFPMQPGVMIMQSVALSRYA